MYCAAMTVTETPFIEPGNLADDALYADAAGAYDDPDTEVIPPVPPADEPPPPGPEAPHGWMKDRSAPGGWRPKKAPGRPKGPRPADELATIPPLDRPPDKVPAAPQLPPDPVPPMPAGGVIARGVNKLYRRAGKIIRAWDRELGQAFIEVTKPDPDDPDAITVGQGWENLCRTNERVRSVVMKAIASNTIAELAAAHLPIGLALVMKPAVSKWIPFMRIAESLAEDDDDDPDDGADLGGLRPADVGEMRDLAEAQAQRMAAKMGVKVPPGAVNAAMAEAQRRGAAPPGGPIPPGFRRQQTPHQARAKRRKGR